MKLVTFLHQDQQKIGGVVADSVYSLSQVAEDMLSFIELGADGLSRAQALIELGQDAIDLDSVSLRAPIPTPRRNIMCLGLNYAEHAAESAAARGQELVLPQTPVVFTKATTSVTGPFDEISHHPAVTDQLDWEVELAFIIGREGKNIPASQAMDYVFGYTVINDLSARDLQFHGKQFFKGKSLDGACPMGPWIVTAGDIADPGDLRISSSVNGVVKQDSTTRELIFDIPTTIAYLSRGMTLLPGDIIATGTPSGVGLARKPPEFLRAGDVVECAVERIGTIRNPIIG